MEIRTVLLIFCLNLKILGWLYKELIKAAKMAACSEDFFIDADMLENGEDFLQETVSTIQQVNQSESLAYPCTGYANICLSKGDLTKHIKRNHPNHFVRKMKMLGQVMKYSLQRN